MTTREARPRRQTFQVGWRPVSVGPDAQVRRAQNGRLLWTLENGVVRAFSQHAEVPVPTDIQDMARRQIFST